MAGRRRSKDDADDDFADIRQARELAGENPSTDEEESEESEEQQSRPSGNSHGLSTRDAAAVGLRYVAEMTGKQPSGVTSVARSKDDSGGWQVVVEVVEENRIPSSADILAQYETRLDDDGELVSYNRTRRYQRGRGDNGSSTSGKGA